jgi:hypothetical protein
MNKPHQTNSRQSAPWLRLGLGLIFGCVCVPLIQAQSDTPPNAFPGQSVDEVLVPVPSEVFSVLKKLGTPDWKKLMEHSATLGTTTDRTALALQLGTVVADGFVAVEAASAPEVEKIGRLVLKLSGALGVQEAVSPHCDAILTASKSGSWDEVRSELEKVQATARQSMDDSRDSALAQCVSLAGWMRGTEVMTAAIKAHYTADTADLLRQPTITASFRQTLKTLRAENKNARLTPLSEGLDALHRLMQPETETPGESEVDEIHETASELVAAMRQAK